MKELKSKFIDMQKKRVKCLKTLLDLQAAAYCTACAVDLNAEGVESSGTVVPSQSTCSRMKGDCFDFME